MKIEKILGAKLCLLSALACLLTSSLNALTIENVWINEIHYDNAGADAGEFVEVAGLANTDLSSLSLEFYNGNDGASYHSIALSGVLSDAGDGYGFQSFEHSGIQNGAPDGIALLFGTAVLQFLSYEGEVSATEGPAEGQTSTDIGVEEGSSTPAGHSLQFLGHADQGSWTGPIASTSGSLNTGQTLPEIIANSDPSSDPVPANSTTLSLLGFGLAAVCACKRQKKRG